jgi:hypothetical protein
MQSSSRTTLESLVDSLQQGLLDPSNTTSGGATSARHVPAGTPHTAPAGSVVLTQHQVNHIISRFSVTLNYFSITLNSQLN